MKPTETLSAKKEQWRQLHGRQKIQYVWDYYKFPIAVCLIFLYIIGYMIYGHFSQKDTLLYTALINVSVDEQLSAQLSDGFIEYTDTDASKNDIQLYTGLYLTDNPNNPNHEYAYASRMKILASIDGEELDVVLMNKEAFDLFSQNEYLCNLEKLFRDSYPDVFKKVEPYLVTSTEMPENNPEDNPEYPTGLDMSQKGIFRQAGFQDTVYLGIIKNSPRMDRAVEYIKYLYSED